MDPSKDKPSQAGSAHDAGGAAQPWAQLVDQMRVWARELGFSAAGVADLEVSEAAARLRQWLAEGRHGAMEFMARQADLRADPARLVPGSLRVISLRMDYVSAAAPADWAQRELARLADPGAAVVSVYARGRDYHRAIRPRVAALARRLGEAVARPPWRAYCDSAPLLEVEFARKAGLGWRGKHALLLTREGGSTFLLGEILTDLPLPVDEPVSAHCGSCRRCIDACPTGAITAPYIVDARRCISYLTIEHHGSIPEELRPAMGNRIYGCDDCQLVCPWNRYAQAALVADFEVRNGLDSERLADLFAWSETDYEARLSGSAIRRLGYRRWLRNLAVALGNAAPDPAALAALRSRADDPDPVVREHVGWALARHTEWKAVSKATSAADAGPRFRSGAGPAGTSG
jgi:epoxyqueuosine reductase